MDSNTLTRDILSNAPIALTKVLPVNNNDDERLPPELPLWHWHKDNYSLDAIMCMDLRVLQHVPQDILRHGHIQASSLFTTLGTSIDEWTNVVRELCRYVLKRYIFL